MQVTENKEGDVICLAVEGNVDTVTAPELQKNVLTAFQKSKHVVIDIEKVPYMSSAGLRVFLIGQKTATSKGGSMKVRHVSDTVMQVLKMSGFAQILTIE